MSSQIPGLFPAPVVCYIYSSFIIQGVMRDASNVLINTTGYKGAFQMRLKSTSQAAMAEATTANGKFTFSGADGGFRIELTPDDTKLLSPGDYDIGALVKGANVNDRTNPLIIGTTEVRYFPVQLLLPT